MDQNQIDVLELDLLSDLQFGLVDFNLSNKWIDEEKRREEDCKNIEFKLKRTKQLKSIARTGFSNSMRRRFWFVLSGGYDLYIRVGNVYDTAIENAKNQPINEKSSFGVSFKYMNFIPPQIVPILPTFLNALWYHNQSIEYSPMIPAIATMLLMYMEPSLAYLSIQAIINRSKESLYYVLLNKSQLFAAIESVEKLIVSRLANVASHAQKLGINLPQLILSIFPSFFIPFISYPVSLTFFDSFVSEGRKIFFRFIIQIMYDERNNLTNTNDANAFGRIIFNAIDRLNDPQIMQEFIKKAFKIKLKRKKIFKKLEKSESELPHPENIELNFSQLHEMLPPCAYKPNGHRRTRTLDSQKRNSIFKFDEFRDFSMANNSSIKIQEVSILPEIMGTQSTETIDVNKNKSSEGIIDTKQTESNPAIIVPKQSNVATTESNESTEVESTKSISSTEIELKAKSSFHSNDSSEFIPDIKTSNQPDQKQEQKVKHHIVKSKDDDDFDNVKDIQTKIAQRWLPSIFSHGEQDIIFTEQMLLLLRNQLPPVFRLYSADLVFKLSVHGSNFQSLFNKCTTDCQYIMIIKTVGGIVGAFLSDPPVPKNSGRYFGSGMTFVFSMKDSKFYKLKKPFNDYFISVSDQTLMIGGPDPALYFENGFSLLKSGKCDTFNSPFLTVNESGDEIIDFEMYKFIPHHYIRERRKSINSIQNLKL